MAKQSYSWGSKLWFVVSFIYFLLIKYEAESTVRYSIIYSENSIIAFGTFFNDILNELPNI